MGAELAITEKGLASLTYWLRRSVLVSKADMVELWAVVGRASTEYRITQLPLVNDCDPDDMARELAGMCAEAEEDAARFKAVAYLGTERVGEIVVKRAGTALATNGAGKPESKPLRAEEAKEKWISDLVRSHNELAKHLTSSTVDRERMYLDQILAARDRIRELESREVEVTRQHVQLIREDRAWAAEQKTQEIRNRALERLADKAVDVLPKVADDFTGWAMTKAGVTAPLPPGVAPHLAKAFELIKGWDADRIRIIAQVFPPAEARVLLDLWEAVTPKPEGAGEKKDTEKKEGGG